MDMLNQDQIDALRAPFPEEALSSDTSRGFELTSIKAAYVIERLNEVFGPCGVGWRYVHGRFEQLETGNGRVEFITEVAFQYRFHATNDCAGCDQVVWDAQAGDWAFRNHGSNHDWSEPIFACGGKSPGKGSAPLTDARKSAVTDGLTKAASMIGVGHEVFKGLVRVGGGNGKHKPSGNGANATAFWELYNSQGKEAEVSLEVAKALAGRDDWSDAIAQLRTLIAEAKA
jgi:hypothetical protein